MEAGSSQLATTSQDPTVEPPRKERKPRHKLKGKGREAEEAVGFVPAAATGGSGAAKVEHGFVEGDDESTWPWASLTENSVNGHPPVFTSDCRYFFSISGSSVKIYATASGQVVSTLSSSTSGSASSSSRQADRHNGDITAILIDPRNTFQLITASLDGKIKVWDYLEASLLSTVEVGEPITHMCAHESVRDHVFVTTTSHKKSKKAKSSTKEHSKVFRVSLRPSKSTAHLPVQKPADILKVGKMRTTTGLAVSPSGSWLVATGGPKAYVCAMSTLSSGFTKFVSNETLTCLAFHPTEEYFATGDQKGQIRLWYCLNQAQISESSHGEKRAETTTLHWHAHAVSSIAFTPNGSYLLSGGEEAVLVIWQLHTGKREFVPRVGAPIVSVAVISPPSAEEEYFLGLVDGTFNFVGAASLRISRSVAHIKLDPNSCSTGPAPIAVHFQTSTLILPSSYPSSLLIYSPLTFTLLTELEVSPSNRVSRRDEKQIEPSRVDRVVVSDSGEWLATIDRREGDEDFEREIYLKMWQWDSATSSWNLNSRIDRPHGVHNVNALTFAPSGDLLISIGDDGNVKVWRIKTVSTKGEQEVFWICRSSLGYRSHIPTDVACSPDGSLLAVGNGPHAVIFEMSTNVFRLALTCPEVKEVHHLTFVGASGRYVLVGGRRDIVLWDLVTTSVQWRHTSPHIIRHVVRHPKNDSFVVMYRGHHPRPTLIRTFDVTSPMPVSERTLPFGLRQVVWYPFISSSSDFTLAGITQSWSTVVFGDHISLAEQEGSSARGIAAIANPHRRNIFEDIFGASAFQDFSASPPRPVATMQDVSTSLVKSNSPLHAPAYLLPPLQTLFIPLIEGLLKKRLDQPPVVIQEEQDEDEDEDEDADIIMAEPPSVSRSGRTPEKGEMDEFVELFKQETFSIVAGQNTSATPRKAAHVNGNGTSKTSNGTHRRKPAASGAHTPVSINGKNHPPKSPANTAERVPDSSPTVVGKKRKKSMD